MKHSYTFVFSILFVGIACIGNSQQFGLEAWSPSGSPPPFDWLYPTGWTTNNATTEFSTSGVKRTTDKHGGTYAAELRTVNIFGTQRKSQLALGNCTLDYPNYALIAHTGGIPLAMVPASVSFYYKLVSDGADNARATLLIKRPDGSGGSDTIVHHQLTLPSVEAYTGMMFTLPDVEVFPESDSIVILFESNDGVETGMNLLYIDDVSIDLVSSIAKGPEASPLEIRTNPVLRGDDICVYGVPDHADITMVDIHGKRVAEARMQSLSDPVCTSVIIATEDLVPGVYFLIAANHRPAKVVIL